MNERPRATIYEIRIQGYLDARRIKQLAELTVRQRPDGVTTLRGALADQAALYGVLSRIRDLGLPLLGVQRIDEQEGSSDESL